MYCEFSFSDEQKMLIFSARVFKINHERALTLDSPSLDCKAFFKRGGGLQSTTLSVRSAVLCSKLNEDILYIILYIPGWLIENILA